MSEPLLRRILREHQTQRRMLALILCLSMFVSLGTFAGLHKNAIAKVYTREVLDCPYAREGAEPVAQVAHVHNDDCYEGETLVCTLPEREAHTHTDACYAAVQVQRCGLEETPGHQHSDACYMPEQGTLICENTDEAHVHDDSCYEWPLTLNCGIPEGEGAHVYSDACFETEYALVCNEPELLVHVHDAGCFYTEEINVDEEAGEPEQTVNTVPEMPVSDPNADLETAEDWERDFENLELSGNWARDLVYVAATQQGRGESLNNFEAILNDAGDAWVKYGYTRYGAWYGYPYAKWDAMFVSFCLRYAGIPAENVPNNPTAAFMAESFSMGGLFAGRDCVPAVGDLVFFDTVVDDDIVNIDHMGIVYHVDTENGTINTVEGDRTDAVATFGYYLDDEQIVGYGILPQNPNYVPDEEENTDNTDEAFDGFIFMTTDEEEEPEEAGTVEETMDTEEAAAPAVPMPAQSWERTAGGIKVSVEAPEGAFPENTRIAVTPVNGNSLKDTVSNAVNGEVLEVQAVDITFFDADGREIEPAIPIRVVMTPAETEHAEEKTSVFHVDVAQQTAELIEQAEGTETDNSEVVFDAEAFTIYAIVYTVHFEYEVDGQVYTSSVPGAEDKLLSELIQELNVVSEDQLADFMSKIAEVSISNPEVLRITETEGDWTIRPLKDSEQEEALTIVMQDRATFRITVEAEGITEVRTEDETTVISTVNDLYLPAEAAAKAEALTEEKSENAIAAVQTEAESSSYQAFSIALENVDVEAYDGFNVTVTLPEDAVVGRDFQLYQVREDGTATDLTESLTVTSEPNEDGLQNVSGISFTTEDFADFVLSYSIETFYTAVDGDTYKITLNYGPKAGIPDGAELKVQEILPEDEEYGNYLNDSAAKLGVNSGDMPFARFFDIEIIKDEEKIEPKAPVQVTISLADVPEETLPEGLKVVHFAQTGLETIDEAQAEQKEDATIDLSFETSGFSVYGVVYTVDFHYEINGKVYEFSIPGGGFVSLEHLVEVLGINVNDTNSSNDVTSDGFEEENDESSSKTVSATVEDAVEIETGAGSEDDNVDTATTSAYEQAINLNSVPVSEETKAFVADIETVEFSNPELVWVGKVNEAATVGGLKEANELEVEYSADLTEEQIAEINAQTVEAGDWALISLMPFETEETLTVTMKNGDQFVIRVTDSQPAATDMSEFAAGNTNHFVIWSTGGNDRNPYALKTNGTTAAIDPSQIDSLGTEFQWTITPGANGRYNFRPVTDNTKALVLDGYHTDAADLVKSTGNPGIYLYPPYTSHKNQQDNNYTDNNAGWIVEGWDWTRLNLGWTSHQFESHNRYCSNINITKQQPNMIALSPMNENGVLPGNPASGNVTSTQYKNMTIDGYTIDDNNDANLDKSRIYIPVQYTDNGTATITLPSNNQLGSFNVSSADPVSAHSIVQDPGKYQWVLHGWYNIATNQYYDTTNGPVTVTVNQSDLNVFYADWWAADYSYTIPEGQRADTVDTSSFVNIKMWDYNEMYNLHGSDIWKVDGDSRLYVQRDSIESEEWYIKNGPYFQFVDNTDPGNCWQYGTLGNTQDRGRYNQWSNYSYSGTLGILGEQGQVPSTGVLESLFPANITPGSGVNYLGQGNYLFSYNESTKTYSYDSSTNAAVYNQNEQRFYVSSTDKKYYRGPGYYESSVGGFFPLNDYEKSLSYNNGTTNNWLGISIDLDFWLPDTPGSSDRANLIADHPMRFEFTGDDDVWVLIDGKLALDIGGIHEAVGGYIDFSTGEIRNAKGNTYQLSEMGIGAGAHTLSFYYLEQGGNASNCKITFNITPRWDDEPERYGEVSVKKRWSENTPEEAKRDLTFSLQTSDGTPVQGTTASYTDGTVTDDGVWHYEWTGLDPDQDYKVVEGGDPRFEATYNDHTGFVNMCWAAASYDKEHAFGSETILIGNDRTSSAGGKLLNGNGGSDHADYVDHIVRSTVSDNEKWTLEGYDASNQHFYLKNTEGKYLTIKNGSISFADVASAASLFYMSPSGDLNDANSDYRLKINEDGTIGVGSIVNSADETSTNSPDRIHVYKYYDGNFSKTTDYNFMNTYQTTDLTVDKKWFTDAESAAAGSSEKTPTQTTIYYKIVQKLGAEDATEYTYAGKIVQSLTYDAAKNDWTAAVHEGLPVIVYAEDSTHPEVSPWKSVSYYVVECNEDGTPLSDDSYVVSYKKNDETAYDDAESAAVSNSDSTRTITIINIDTKASVKIFKVNADDYVDALTAEFKITRKNTAGAYVVYTDDSTEGINNEGKFSVNENGIEFIFPPGEYKIEEVTPPPGYIISADSTFYFTIEKGTVTYTDVSGNKITDSSNMLVRYMPKNETEPATFKVGNYPGTALPNSGGIGTALFTMLGVLMTITAGAVLTIRARKGKTKTA